MRAGSPNGALARWEAAWCDAMLEALASPQPRLAANVSAYALPVPLAMESGSIVTLLRRILDDKASGGLHSDGQVGDGSAPDSTTLPSVRQLKGDLTYGLHSSSACHLTRCTAPPC
jgi:hypothetical protein